MPKRKPVVYYREIYQAPRVGEVTYLRPINHYSPYVSNTREVQTSVVHEIHADGEFHTENTIYRRYPESKIC
jgi:hypothetical protein